MFAGMRTSNILLLHLCFLSLTSRFVGIISVSGDSSHRPGAERGPLHRLTSPDEEGYHVEGEEEGCRRFDRIIEGLTVGLREEDIRPFRAGIGCGSKPMESCPRCHASGDVTSCCSFDTDTKLMARSRRDFDRLLTNQLNSRRNILTNVIARFDIFSLQLIDKSKRSLHDMYIQTYGQLFHDNSDIFVKLYRDLLQFYRGEVSLDLVETVDRFFAVLFQRMFILFNSQHSLTEKYLSCVAEHVDVIRPFGDVPQKLSAHVRRSFTAARAFVQALNVAREVIKDMAKQNLSRSCYENVGRMLYCRYCTSRGGVGGEANEVLKPCQSHCADVSRDCFEPLIEINHVWNNFINELLKLSSRLEGSFSIENVVDPMEITISEGIMNYQENSLSISQQVFQGCGPLEYGLHTKTKRRAMTRNFTSMTSLTSSRLGSSSFSSSSSQRESTVQRKTTVVSQAFEQMMNEFGRKLGTLLDTWTALPTDVCLELTGSSSARNDTGCWNGRRRAVYGRHRLENQDSGDVNVKLEASSANQNKATVKRKSWITEQAVVRLNVTIVRIRSAYSGLNIDWTDTDDREESSGNDPGEGSGSGWDIIPPGINNHPYEDINFTTDKIRSPVVVTVSRPTSSNSSAHLTFPRCSTWLFFMTVFLTTTAFINRPASRSL